MAIVKCPECTHDVSDKAASCPRCGCPIASVSAQAPPHGSSSGHVPPHLTPAALLRKFPAVTEMVPGEVRGLVGPGESVLYFGFIGRKGGCASRQKAKQWIMITTSRVSYRATVSKSEGAQTLFAETAGSILLPQISYVGSAQSSAGCGCTNTKTHNVIINSSGGSITIAMPSQAEMNRVQAFLESVLQPS